jgi:hypothetical protein
MSTIATITIDIATQLAAGLATAVTSIVQTAPNGETASVTIRAKGVKNDALKWGDPIQFPEVALQVSEAMNHDQAQSSKLRDYEVQIQAGTHYTNDPWQLTFYAICQAVGQYLLAPPVLTLNLTTCTFMALSLPVAPVASEVQDQNGGLIQTMLWRPVVRVQVA